MKGQDEITLDLQWDFNPMLDVFIIMIKEMENGDSQPDTCIQRRECSYAATSQEHQEPPETRGRKEGRRVFGDSMTLSISGL